MEKAFIVGMYKSGTSWLLECLASHPDVAALAELDLVRAVNGTGNKVFSPLNKDEVLKNIFGRSAFMNLPKAFIEKNEGVYRWPAEKMLEALRDSGRLNFRKERTSLGIFFSSLMETRCTHPIASYGLAFRADDQRVMRPIQVDGIADQYLLKAIEAIRNQESSDAIGMMDSFVRNIEPMFRDRTKMLVLKGADQVVRFDLLEQWQPDAKKIAIVRDGRDACISAHHFRSMMLEQGAAFVPQQASTEYQTLLKAWTSRAQMLIDLQGRQNLKIIRYEDLLDNFENTLSDVLAYLNLPAGKKLLLEIKLRNSFRVVTGRKAGDMAKDIRRGGISGEWMSALTKQQKDEAWQVAGKQLQAFGYGKDGKNA